MLIICTLVSLPKQEQSETKNLILGFKPSLPHLASELRHNKQVVFLL